MDGVCEVTIQDGKEWVIFYSGFNGELTPPILKFLSRYQRVKFEWNLINQLINYQTL